MNNNDEENKVLTDLYQLGNQEQPPEKLDDIILKQAQQKAFKGPENTKSKNNWHPWLAAASVVLVVPMIWLLTQDQGLNEMSGDLNSVETPQALPQSESFIEAEVADDAAGLADETDQREEQQGKITVTGSRIQGKPSVAPAPMVDLQEKIEQQGQQSITGRPVDQESLQANKAKLMNEFKAKKRTIKPSTMDPLMALEYEQFGRYLELGEIEKADQLLTEMQENWPDFDFEDMVYRLAEAEINVN